MMIAVNIPDDMRYNMFCEAFTCTTQLDWIVIIELDGVKVTKIEHWCGELPKWSQALSIWGGASMGYIKCGIQTPNEY
eukprot:7402363-Ditylum_brightwellii.AAC.1